MPNPTLRFWHVAKTVGLLALRLCNKISYQPQVTSSIGKKRISTAAIIGSTAASHTKYPRQTSYEKHQRHLRDSGENKYRHISK